MAGNSVKNVGYVGKVAAQFPPLDKFVAVHSALAALSKHDDLAALYAKRMEKGIEGLRDLLGSVILNSEHNVDDEQANARQPVDLKTITINLKQSSSALENFLGRVVDKSELTALHKDYSSVSAVAEALIKLAKPYASKNTKVGVYTDTVKQDLEVYVEAKARIDAGGHAALPPEVSKKVTRLWALLDGGYLVLEACLLQRGILSDEVLAGQPPFTPKNPLRHRVTAGAPVVAQPAAKPKKNEKASKKGASGKSGGGSGVDSSPKS